MLGTMAQHSDLDSLLTRLQMVLDDARAGRVKATEATEKANAFIQGYAGDLAAEFQRRLSTNLSFTSEIQASEEPAATPVSNDNEPLHLKRLRR